MASGTSEQVRHDARLIGGRWEIIGEIADGGMGTVYSARHVQTRKRAAVKVIERSDPESQARFRIEARVATELEHPGIVDVYDADVDPATGQCFIAMELLEGRTLREVMDDPDTPPRAIFDLLVQALDPLVVAHSKGYVHRDLKPENIFVVEDAGVRRVKLLDFGIAGHEEQRGLTQTGTAMGTPHYMSPEQAMNARDAAPAADIWAMGVLMYEALSGRTPFKGETAHAVVVHACTQDPPELIDLVDDLEPALAALVMRCLNKDPAARPENASALLLSLSRVMRPDSLPAQRGSVQDVRTVIVAHEEPPTVDRMSAVSSLIPQTTLASHGPLMGSVLGACLMLLSMALYASGVTSVGQLAFFGLLGSMLAAFGVLGLRPDVRARVRETQLSLRPPPKSERPAPAPTLTHPVRGDVNTPIRIDLFVDLSCALSRRIAQRVMDVLRGFHDVAHVVLHALPPSDKHIAWLTAEATQEAFEREGNETFWAFHDRLLLQRRKITPDLLHELALSLGLNMLSFKHAMRVRLHRATILSIREQALSEGVTVSPTVLINGQLVGGELSEQNITWALEDALKLANRGGQQLDLQQTIAALPSGIPASMQLRQIVVCYRGARHAPKAVRRTREQALERAEKLRARVCLPGADFADLAMRFSDTDMDVGTVALHELAEPVLHAVMRLPVGGVSVLLECEDGFRLYQRMA